MVNGNRKRLDVAEIMVSVEQYVAQWTYLFSGISGAAGFTQMKYMKRGVPANNAPEHLNRSW